MIFLRLFLFAVIIHGIGVQAFLPQERVLKDVIPDSTLLNQFYYEVLYSYVESEDTNLTEEEIYEFLDENRMSFNEPYLVYSPDSLFKIIYMEAEGCGAYCNPFWESRLYFNKGNHESVDLRLANVLDIIKLNDTAYLVMQDFYGRPAGFYTVEGNAATLLMVNKGIVNYGGLDDQGEVVPGLNITLEEGLLTTTTQHTVDAEYDDVFFFDFDENRLYYQFGYDMGIYDGSDTIAISDGYFELEDGQLKLNSNSTRYTKHNY